MAIIDTIKDMVAVVQKADNIELMKHVLALQTQIQEILEENHNLNKNNRKLVEALNFSDSLTFKTPFYFAQDDKTPLCPRCWEVDKNVVHVVVSIFKRDRNRWDCPQCARKYLIEH